MKAMNFLKSYFLVTSSTGFLIGLGMYYNTKRRFTFNDKEIDNRLIKVLGISTVTGLMFTIPFNLPKTYKLLFTNEEVKFVFPPWKQ